MPAIIIKNIILVISNKINALIILLIASNIFLILSILVVMRYSAL